MGECLPSVRKALGQFYQTDRQTDKQKALLSHLVISHGNPSTLSLGIVTFLSPLTPPTPSFPILTVFVLLFFFFF